MEKTPSISQEELELIERFWRGEFVDEEEKTALEEHYAHDSVWREKADWVRLSTIAIQEASLEDKLDSFHKYLVKEKPIRHMGWRQWIVAASIVAVVVCGTLFFLTKSPEEKLFAEYYKPDPGLPTLMGVADNYDFENAMVSYKTGDYQKAIAAWNKLLVQNPSNDTLHYFIASAYLADKQPDKALPFFDRVIADTHSIFLQEAQWYKALVLLHSDKKQKAILLLEKTEYPNKEELLHKLKE